MLAISMVLYNKYGTLSASEILGDKKAQTIAEKRAGDSDE